MAAPNVVIAGYRRTPEDDGPTPIDSGDVNAFLREIAGEEFTAKDFRTWAAAVLAAWR